MATSFLIRMAKKSRAGLLSHGKQLLKKSGILGGPGSVESYWNRRILKKIDGFPRKFKGQRLAETPNSSKSENIASNFL